jgi:branched-chain amino acid transport system ATP-binding protein
MEVMFLQIRKLRKSFGKLMAVYDVSLDVEQGERLAVIGPNGAGKSTFFNLLSGFHTPDAGEVLFKGKNLTRLSPDQIVRRGVGRSFQIVNIYPDMPVFESIQMTLIAGFRKSYHLFSPARKMFRRETEEILAKVGLENLADIPGGMLSHGDKKRLEVGMVLASKSELILLDEPTAGMAPDERLATMALINELAQRERLTLLFTEHDMSVVFAWAQRIAVMVQGMIIADGPPEQIRQDPKVRKVYLGEKV